MSDQTPRDIENDGPRFWLNYDPGPAAPSYAAYALVDEHAGGEVAYFDREETAIPVLDLLHELEKSQASAGWVMIQINNGEPCVTAHLTKEGAYNDIIDTYFEDPSWLGLDPDDQESAEILQRYRNQRDDFTAEQFYNGFIHGALEKENGFWMEVQALNYIPQETKV